MHHTYSGLLSLALVLTGCGSLSQQNPAPLGQWHHAGGNHASAKYSPLEQINSNNFSSLEVAWRWLSADTRIPRQEAYGTGDYRAAPLVVNGVMYTNTNHGQVVALDPVTGRELWLYDPESYRHDLSLPKGGPSQTRSIEYWTDGEIERLFVATLGKQLLSIDIKTGLPDPNFGDAGIVDLRGDFGKNADEINLDYITHGAPPIAVGNSVIVGSSIYDYSEFNHNPPGHVRAYDARSGGCKWR